MICVWLCILMMFVEDALCHAFVSQFMRINILYFLVVMFSFYFCSLIQEYLKEPFSASIQMIYTLAENEERRKSCVDTLTKYTHTSCMYMYMCLSNTSIVYNSLFFAFILYINFMYV